METFKRQKKGFTLAEVLITLGIIGVVAALTIPTLIKNYQNMQIIVGLKKSYAELTTAVKLMANDSGCADNLSCVGVFSDSDPSTMDNNLANELMKYIKAAKICPAVSFWTDETPACFPTNVSYNYDGSGGRGPYPRYSSFISADGFAVAVINRAKNCDDNYAANGQANLNVSKICGDLYVDVNGLNGPNNFGKDIFKFFITNGKGPALYPDGGSELINSTQTYSWDDASGSPTSCYEGNPNGMYCAGRIMEQGWQIKYATPPPRPADSPAL